MTDVGKHSKLHRSSIFVEKHLKLDQNSITDVGKYSKLDQSSNFVEKYLKLDQNKETGKFMDTDMHKFGKCSF